MVSLSVLSTARRSQCFLRNSARAPGAQLVAAGYHVLESFQLLQFVVQFKNGIPIKTKNVSVL